MLFTVSAGSTLLGVSKGASWHWLSAQTLSCFAVAVTSAVTFLLLQPRAEDPFLDMKFIRSKGVRQTLLLAFLLSVPLGGYTYIVPQMLLNTGGAAYAFALTALAVGFYTLPQRRSPRPSPLLREAI